MRTIILLAFCLYSMSAIAQNSATTSTFVVKGNCEQCKERIENAADIKGVKLLIWNEETKVATVTYNREKISLEQIQNAIAAKGHDAGELHGNDGAYKKLPKCCQYRDGKCVEDKK